MSHALLQDFVKFREEPSAASRADLAKKICTQFNAGAFKEKEKSIVEEILSYLAEDIEVGIRKILSETLKKNTELPHEVALKLAYDIEEVSIPILEFSKVLSDEDLISLIKSSEQLEKLTAIAKRDTVSEVVTGALIQTKKEVVVTTVLANKTAQISDESVDEVIACFKGFDNVLGALINRGNLKPAVAERMVSLVSDKLRKELVTKYAINPAVAGRVVDSAQEDSTLGLIIDKKPGKLSELINHLYHSGKLGHSIVLRALCKGDLEFFEAGIAKLASIPLPNAQKLVREGDAQAFDALFRAAHMPHTMLDATRILLNILLEEMKRSGKNTDDSNLPRRVMEKIIQSKYDQDVPNMRYLMTLVGDRVSDHRILH